MRTRAARPSPEPPVPPRPPVTLKGRGDEVHIVVSPADPQQVEASLATQIGQRAQGFFAGAAAVLELPPGALDLSLAARLAAVIEAAGMSLTTVRSRPASTSARARPEAASSATTDGPAAARIVTGTVRGGQRVVHDGSIVVLGDVNPGGEVIAGGSVIVWGRLRGHVEAGLAAEAGDCVVCALDLSPTQLRIGPALARAPDDPDHLPVPEVARQISGQIVVDAWR